MPDALTPTTHDFDWIALADRIGRDIAPYSAQHDRDGSFVREGYTALREAGMFKALIPTEFGGGGADYRAVCGAIRRLATHCGSTALAFSMHCHLVAVPVWRWRNEGAPVEGLLKRIAGEDLILVSTGGSDWLPGSGRAVKVDGGFRIHARKIFCSGAPMGDLLMTMAIHDDPEAGPTVLHFGVPMRAEGVRVLDTWQALGMRGTGSHDVELDGVFVPDAGIAARRAPGKWNMLFYHIHAIAFPMVYSAYVGVAEGARAKALGAVRGRPDAKALSAAAGRLENAYAKAELGLDWMIRIAETEAAGPERAGRAAMARTLTGQAAVETVERAMELAGGASFYQSLGLERDFRDVQGARFHALREQPQLEMTGRLALGLDIDG